jgi:cytochrome c556
MNLGRHVELGYSELDQETGEQVSEGDRLHELGTKFEADKTKLEDAMERVQTSNIKPEDKARMIAELNAAIDALQTQYAEDVAAEQARIQAEIEGQLEQMEQSIQELAEQADSLRGVSMDAAATDASAAADAADTKKQEFEQMKEEYTAKLQLQMEQAEMQQRNIRNRRLSGR